MDKDKGWLDEVLRDVSDDSKSWPKWLKEQDSEKENKLHTSPDKREKAASDTKIFD